MADIIVNGKTLEGDFFDADFMERYEDATRELHEVATACQNKTYPKVSDAFREQCDISRRYFDAIFGDGTALELFGESDNLKICMEAIAELTERAAKAKKEVNDLTNKYTQRQRSFANQQGAQQFISQKRKK